MWLILLKLTTAGRHARARAVRTSFGGKGVALYVGKKRIQMHGSGQQLRDAIRKYALRHPPKEDYLDVPVEEVLMHPERFFEKGGWGARPTIDSI